MYLVAVGTHPQCRDERVRRRRGRRRRGLAPTFGLFFRIIDQAEREQQRYEDVFLFAGDGSKTIYGFDAAHDNEIVEGDWIGLNRDEMIVHGHTLRRFLEKPGEPTKLDLSAEGLMYERQ